MKDGLTLNELKELLADQVIKTRILEFNLAITVEQLQAVQAQEVARNEEQEEEEKE